MAYLPLSGVEGRLVSEEGNSTTPEQRKVKVRQNDKLTPTKIVETRSSGGDHYALNSCIPSPITVHKSTTNDIYWVAFGLRTINSLISVFSGTRNTVNIKTDPQRSQSSHDFTASNFNVDLRIIALCLPRTVSLGNLFSWLTLWGGDPQPAISPTKQYLYHILTPTRSPSHCVVKGWPRREWKHRCTKPWLTRWCPSSYRGECVKKTYAGLFNIKVGVFSKIFFPSWTHRITKESR